MRGRGPDRRDPGGPVARVGAQQHRVQAVSGASGEFLEPLQQRLHQLLFLALIEMIRARCLYLGECAARDARRGRAVGRLRHHARQVVFAVQIQHRCTDLLQVRDDALVGPVARIGRADAGEGADRGWLGVTQPVGAHQTAQAMRHDDRVLETLLAEESQGGLHARRHLVQHREVILAARIGCQHRHLQRQRGPAVLREAGAQWVDHVRPVRVHTTAVNDDHRTLRRVARRRCIERQESMPIGIEVFDIAGHDRIGDLRRPPVFACQIGRRGRRAQHQEQNTQQPVHRFDTSLRPDGAAILTANARPFKRRCVRRHAAVVGRPQPVQKR